jgi:hypothetical protein
LTEKHDLENVDEWLVADWQDGTSVRDLTTAFNERVVARHVAESKASPVQWDRTRVYEALGAGNSDDPDSIEIRRALERAGVDLAPLESDIVSHQTVYRHLTDCLDATADTEVGDDERRENAFDTVYALQRRTELVTESQIESLQSAGVASIGDPDAIVDVRILCRECGRSMDLERAVTDGCDCGES